MTPALEIRGVSKRFGSLEAVRPLDLVAQRGALIGLLGPNGAGKSTLIRMIMSLIRPDTGELRVLGGDALDMKDRIGPPGGARCLPTDARRRLSVLHRATQRAPSERIARSDRRMA